MESDSPLPEQPRIEGTFDTRETVPVGDLLPEFPDEDDPIVAHQALTIDLKTTGPAEKVIRWSQWRNHLYPIF